MNSSGRLIIIVSSVRLDSVMCFGLLVCSMMNNVVSVSSLLVMVLLVI